jgi:hypothetical protein
VVDELDMLEAEGKAKREAKKAARKTPEAKAKRNTGRIQRQRGYKAEKDIEKRLKPYGFYRVPLSGALGGERFSGDLRRDGQTAVRVVEVKRRQGAQKELRSYLSQGNADLLIIVPGSGDEPLAVMTLTKLQDLLGEAEYGAS